jgi:hypothetical protein
MTDQTSIISMNIHISINNQHSPQKIHLRLFWSRIFCSEASRGSKSSDMLEEYRE